MFWLRNKKIDFKLGIYRGLSNVGLWSYHIPTDQLEQMVQTRTALLSDQGFHYLLFHLYI